MHPPSHLSSQLQPPGQKPNKTKLRRCTTGKNFMADKEINCAKARAGQASGPVNRTELRFPAARLCLSRLSGRLPPTTEHFSFRASQTYSDIYHHDDILKFTSPISGGDDFNRVTDSDRAGHLHSPDLTRARAGLRALAAAPASPQGPAPLWCGHKQLGRPRGRLGE